MVKQIPNKICYKNGKLAYETIAKGEKTDSRSIILKRNDTKREFKRIIWRRIRSQER